MARIFRALLIAAVNAIQEFFAFATDNGESQVGDSVKLNDGMATSNYDWSAYPSDNNPGIPWTQPTLSANGTLGGDSFAVSLTNPYSATYDAWKAFDNNSGTCFWTQTIPADLIIYNPKQLKITSLSWEVYDYNRRPTDWEWYGSNDNETYILLDSGTNDSNTFTLILSGGYYKYHKFKVLTAYNELNAKQINLTAYIEAPFSVTGTIEKVKQIGNDFVYGMQEPKQDNKDVTISAGKVYYAYTNANDESVYAVDNPISESPNPSILYDSSFQELNPQPEFTIMQKGLQNATIYGSFSPNNGVYSGFSSYNFLYINTSTPQTSMDFIIKCNPSTGFGDLLRTQPDGKGILLRCSSGSVLCYLSSTGSGWNVLGGFNTGIAMTSNTDVYVRITWNSTDGVYTFWQSSDGETWTERNSSSGGLAAPYWSGGNQTIGGCTSYSEHWYGSVDMKETSLTIDGNKTIFYNTIDGIIINSNNYIKTSNNDLVQPITATIETVDNTTINSVSIISDQTATIETSANITTSNNDNVITDGSYHLFNLTAPQDMTTYIQSNGINYQLLDMPLLIKRNSGVGLLIKDNNTILYRRSWTLERDLDLHYQIVKFNLNVDNANIVFKVDNREIPFPYIVYSGDAYTYTISKEGYVDYSGSGTVSYSSKDGNEIDISITLIPSAGTVDTTDYTYTIDNEGNMIITGYVGTNADTITPNITEN